MLFLLILRPSCLRQMLSYKHMHLAAMVEIIQKMPLDFVSHLVHTDQLEQAIVTLERGRALLWSELRGLRTSINHITAVDPQLAQKLTRINQDLEQVMMSVLPSGSTELSSNGTEDGGRSDPFGRLLMEQRKLLEKCDSIISEVRTLTGLQNF